MSFAAAAVRGAGRDAPRGEEVWRRLGVVIAAALLIALITGCHKRTTVARNPPPPPMLPRRLPTVERRPAATPPAKPREVPAPPADPGTAVASRSVETGLASWYAPSGHRSSNGEVYDGESLTAAHRTLPLETVVRVTNLTTHQSTTVRITDRGPFVRGRILDLSTVAAKSIGVYRMGVAPVRLEILQAGPGVSAAGRWCVQVGAFTRGSNADRLREELTRQYSSAARVIEFQGATGMWVRINPVGGDRARAAAIAQSVQVSEPEAQAWLVRLD